MGHLPRCVKVPGATLGREAREGMAGEPSKGLLSSLRQKGDTQVNGFEYQNVKVGGDCYRGNSLRAPFISFDSSSWQTSIFGGEASATL